MKRFAIILAALVLASLTSSAQDLIVKRTGEEIRTKVTAVGPDTISYKLYDTDDGVVYTIMKGDVVLIKYQDGRNEVIKSTSSSYDPLLYGTREPVAGIRPGMKYRELKEYYNHKEYVRGLIQHHNPAGVGVGSYFLPGLGQMICGEGWRGGAYLAGWLASLTCQSIALQQDSEPAYLICAAAGAAIRICSVVDAVRVAKVKNMYERDLMRMASVDMELYPSVNYIKTSSGIQPAAGLTFAMRF